MIAATSTYRPPTAATTLPQTSVDVTTWTRPSATVLGAPQPATANTHSMRPTSAARGTAPGARAMPCPPGADIGNHFRHEPTGSAQAADQPVRDEGRNRNAGN